MALPFAFPANIPISSNTCCMVDWLSETHALICPQRVIHAVKVPIGFHCPCLISFPRRFAETLTPDMHPCQHIAGVQSFAMLACAECCIKVNLTNTFSTDCVCVFLPSHILESVKSFGEKLALYLIASVLCSQFLFF